MSTGKNDQVECRWCGMFHGPICWAVKALEFQADGVTVKRVEFKTAADYPQQMSAAPSAFVPPDVPSNLTAFAGLPEHHHANSVQR